MNLNVKDEILTGEPKYKIKQNDTTLYNNVTIEMVTPVQEQGTPINKALFDKIEDNVKKIDRYTEPTIEESNTIYEESPENFFEYDKLASCTGDFKNLQYAFDDDENTYARNTNDETANILIDTGRTIKNATINIKQMRQDAKFTLSGSNDNTNWTTLLGPIVSGSSDTFNDSVTISDAEYRYFKLNYIHRSSYNMYVYINSVKILKSDVKAQILNIDSTVDTYDNMGLVNIKTPSTLSAYVKPYIKFKNLEVKLINAILEPNKYYELIYINNAYELLSNVKRYEIERTITSGMIPTSGWIEGSLTADDILSASSTNEFGRWDIKGSSDTSDIIIHYAVDGDEASYVSIAKQGYFAIFFPTDILIKAGILQIKDDTDETTSHIDSIQGKLENGVWETINYTTINNTAGKKTLLIPPKYYTAIKINFTRSSSVRLYEFTIMQGNYIYKS